MMYLVCAEVLLQLKDTIWLCRHPFIIFNENEAIWMAYFAIKESFKYHKLTKHKNYLHLFLQNIVLCSASSNFWDTNIIDICFLNWIHKLMSPSVNNFLMIKDKIRSFHTLKDIYDCIWNFVLRVSKCIYFSRFISIWVL
jgi:hypothetical protein